MKPEDSKAIKRFCGAVLEYRDMQPYKTHIKKAGDDLRDGTMTEELHQKTVDAIIKNLLHQKENPFDELQRKYKLPITREEFTARKIKFCLSLARRCGFPYSAPDSTFTKKDILDMLFAIADEANECIVKDGSFNHQVAGVALKAIDQAVRLSGMCGEETRDELNEILMDEPSRKLGA